MQKFVRDDFSIVLIYQISSILYIMYEISRAQIASERRERVRLAFPTVEETRREFEAADAKSTRSGSVLTNFVRAGYNY